MLNQSAVGEQRLHSLRQRSDLDVLVFGFILDYSGVKIDFQFVPFIDAVSIALNCQQAQVKAVAVEDAGKGFSDDSRNAGIFNGHRGLLSGGAAAKVFPRNEKIPFFNFIIEIWPDISHYMLCQFMGILNFKFYSSRYYIICINIVPKFMCPSP